MSIFRISKWLCHGSVFVLILLWYVMWHHYACSGHWHNYFMQHGQAACAGSMCRQNVQAACAGSMCRQHVQATCAGSMCRQHVQAAWASAQSIFLWFESRNSQERPWEQPNTKGRCCKTFYRRNLRIFVIS